MLLLTVAVMSCAAALRPAHPPVLLPGHPHHRRHHPLLPGHPHHRHHRPLRPGKFIVVCSADGKGGRHDRMPHPSYSGTHRASYACLSGWELRVAGPARLAVQKGPHELRTSPGGRAHQPLPSGTTAEQITYSWAVTSSRYRARMGGPVVSPGIPSPDPHLMIFYGPARYASYVG